MFFNLLEFIIKFIIFSKTLSIDDKLLKTKSIASFLIDFLIYYSLLQIIIKFYDYSL